MYRKRLRPMPSAAELAELYATPHDHTRWADHLLRVDVTVQVGCWMIHRTRPVIADLSTGDGAIPRGIAEEAAPEAQLILGDYAPGYEYTGPIERTVEELADDSANLFVCSETLEHLDNPDAVLARIRAKAHRLLVSTPIGETDPADNPEHVWGWDTEAVCAMLAAAGWRPVVVNELRLTDYLYDFMIIGAERA